MKKLIMREIQTAYNPPPIPDRSYDWMAYRYSHDEGEPIGHGETELEAIEDLINLEIESINYEQEGN